MSTYEEHAREAERLIRQATTVKSTGVLALGPNSTELLAWAQVHATLALAAATAERPAKGIDSDD